MPSKNKDAGLQAAIASVRADDGPHGERNDFEAAATHLLPYDPVAKKRLSGTKRGAGIISTVSWQKMIKLLPQQVANHQLARLVSTFDTTKKQEYNKLSQEQNDELREWRENSNVKPTAKSDGKGKKKAYTKKQLASLVTKRVKLEMDKSSEKLKTQDDTKAYIMSLIQEVVAPGTKSQASVSNAVDTHISTLNSILKRAKNSKT
jgi:hypothetical protein